MEVGDTIVGYFRLGRRRPKTPVRTLDSIRQECWDEALHCFATYTMFERRSSLLRKKLRMLTFLGVVVPASVGAAFMSFGAKSNLTIAFLAIASILGLVQLVGSIWSLTNRWDDDFGYAVESLSANRTFFERFKALAEHPPKVEEANYRYDLLQAESQSRSMSDEKQGISEAEKRYGMRAALRQLQRKCACCVQIPTSMRSSECDVCGNF